jgi:hypothetical protein
VSNSDSNELDRQQGKQLDLWIQMNFYPNPDGHAPDISINKNVFVYVAFFPTIIKSNFLIRRRGLHTLIDSKRILYKPNTDKPPSIIADRSTKLTVSFFYRNFFYRLIGINCYFNPTNSFQLFSSSLFVEVNKLLRLPFLLSKGVK